MVCKGLGIFATAHADGKLYLRALPDVEAEDSPTVTIGEQPIQALTHDSVAVVQVRHCLSHIICKDVLKPNLQMSSAKTSIKRRSLLAAILSEHMNDVQ